MTNEIIRITGSPSGIPVPPKIDRLPPGVLVAPEQVAELCARDGEVVAADLHVPRAGGRHDSGIDWPERHRLAHLGAECVEGAADGATELRVQPARKVRAVTARDIHVLETGEIRLSGSADELRHEAHVREAYLGS